MDKLANFNEKLEKLKNSLVREKSIAVAFSGGVDSSFLLKIAADVLGDRVMAITVKSPLLPGSELEEAKNIAKTLKIRHFIAEVDCLAVPGIKNNSKNRCYLCKKNIFSALLSLKSRYGFNSLMEATIIEEGRQWRPGLKALKELEISSPLKDAHISKKEIRDYLKSMGFYFWNKPSATCLATRFPYNEEITAEKLEMVEKAEEALKNLGFTLVRVRYFWPMARIELSADELKAAVNPETRKNILKELNDAGFRHIVLDLAGYRFGSMDE